MPQFQAPLKKYFSFKTYSHAHIDTKRDAIINKHHLSRYLRPLCMTFLQPHLLSTIPCCQTARQLRWSMRVRPLHRLGPCELLLVQRLERIPHLSKSSHKARPIRCPHTIHSIEDKRDDHRLISKSIHTTLRYLNSHCHERNHRL